MIWQLHFQAFHFHPDAGWSAVRCAPVSCIHAAMFLNIRRYNRLHHAQPINIVYITWRARNFHNVISIHLFDLITVETMYLDIYYNQKYQRAKLSNILVII